MPPSLLVEKAIPIPQWHRRLPVVSRFPDVARPAELDMRAPECGDLPRTPLEGPASSDPPAELVAGSPGTGDQENYQLVKQKELVRCDPQHAAPERLNAVAEDDRRSLGPSQISGIRWPPFSPALAHYPPKAAPRRILK
ncbi:hypothetical protein [Sorangium sp. So ce363]|uniref:hypothetical protein n=1 Tax=Sorangium sp. So ce363 TaxID=3133304 RepID=UPI003F5F9820